MRIDEMRRASLAMLIATLFAPSGSAHAQPAAGAEIGVIERVSGEVAIVEGTSRAVSAGAALRVGELVSTGRGGEALIRFRDESTMALRSDTQVRITEFSHQTPGSESFVSRLVKGTIRSVSGLIARARPRGVQYQTPTATIGIRGTDLEIAIIPAGERDRAGIYNFVHDGSTSMELAGQSLDVQREETGFAPETPQAGEPALLLLRERPAFLRGGGFDALMLQVNRPVPLMPMFRR